MALAMLALARLEGRAGERLLPTDPAAALRDLFLPGRFQLVLRDPDWIFDTAHNQQALTEALGAFAARPCRGRRFVLFGAMHDKELPVGVGQALHGCGGVLGAPVALPRSRGRDELAAIFTGWGLREAGADTVAPLAGRFALADDVPAALRRLSPILTADDAVLVTGSCFLVAEVLHQLGYAKLTDTRTPKPAPRHWPTW